MKRAITTLLLIACLFSLMSISAFAADDVNGVYNVTTKAGYTLTPQDSEGKAASVGNATVDGAQVSGFYAGAERFELTGPSTDAYHLVLMLSGTSQIPTESNIYYIDQDSGGSISFGIYPKAMQKGDYKVYISSSDGSGLTEVASFSYYQAYTLGDVDNNGKIDSADALKVLQCSVKLVELTEVQKLAANVKKDNNIDSADALRILQYSVKLISSFD